jgi:hypothetical protein
MILYFIGGFTEDVDNKKINLPGGLCANKPRVRLCMEYGYCICCLVTNYCYEKMAECMERCNKSAYSGPANNRPLPSHQI